MLTEQSKLVNSRSRRQTVETSHNCFAHRWYFWAAVMTLSRRLRGARRAVLNGRGDAVVSSSDGLQFSRCRAENLVGVPVPDFEFCLRYQRSIYCNAIN